MVSWSHGSLLRPPLLLGDDGGRQGCRALATDRMALFFVLRSGAAAMEARQGGRTVLEMRGGRRSHGSFHRPPFVIYCLLFFEFFYMIIKCTFGEEMVFFGFLETL